MTKKVVRYKRINGALVKQFEVPPLIGGLVDIASLPIVGTAGSAVIERGSNANGEYTKFADDDMHKKSDCASKSRSMGELICFTSTNWKLSSCVYGYTVCIGVHVFVSSWISDDIKLLQPG